MEEPAADDYRRAMRAFATGVAIVACGEGAGRAGCVATAVASLSLTPPSLIVNLQRDGSTLRRLRECALFSVNFLSDAQEPTARRFSGGPDRFAAGEWSVGLTGAPRLDGALAVLECRVEEILPRFTHAIVIGRVEAASARDGAALLHFRGRFQTI